jgi:hypothetical protein
VDIAIGGKEVLTIGAQRVAISVDDLAQLSLDVRLAGQLLDRDDQRRIADDPHPSVHVLRQLPEGSNAVLGLRLVEVAFDPAEASLVRLRTQRLERRIDVDPRVPDLEVAHRGVPPDRPPVAGGGGEHGAPAFFLAKAPLASGDRNARDQPLDVPLERARAGLVEVVAVEDEFPVRRRKDAEVREVRVAAELDGEASVRRRRQIGRHHRRRSAEESKGRGEHPRVADRNQLRHAALVLAGEDRHRISRGEAQLGVDGARSVGSRRFALRRPLDGIFAHGLGRHIGESPTFT